MNKVKGIVFYLYNNNFFFYDNTGEKTLNLFKNYNEISEDKENYSLCVHRERYQEIESCEKLGIPYFYYIYINEDKNDEVGLPLKKLILTDKNFNEINNLNGYDILLRSTATNYLEQTKLITDIGGNVTGIFDYIRWFEYVIPKYIGRNIILTDIDKINNDIDKINGDKIFMKTVEKKVSGIGNKNNIVYDVFGDQLYSIDDNMELLISDVIDIKKEYRCYVINGKLSSISEYEDYIINEIPDDIYKFANSFIFDHKIIFGNHANYVLDICITNDENNKIQVVELNDLRGAGRYGQNDPYKMISDFVN